jgi:aquaporin Z
VEKIFNANDHCSLSAAPTSQIMGLLERLIGNVGQEAESRNNLFSKFDVERLYTASAPAEARLTKEGGIRMQKHSWWRRLHWPEYGSELVGTALLVFLALSAVTLDFGSGSPLASVLPNRSVRRLMTGLLLAGCGPLLTISPPGKLSGAHLNPAVSLAFWLQGKMHRHDLVGYLASQFLGAALGAGLAVLIWSVFLLEMGCTCLLVLAIFLFVSSHRLMHWTPLMTWLLVALIYWQAAPISGCSLNPARSFGPALVSWFWRDQWVYYLAAPIGRCLPSSSFGSFAWWAYTMC